MTLKVIAIEVLSHLICGTIMYFVARARWGNNAWWWGAIGLITGPIGFVVFLAFVGWQVMFEKGAEQRRLRHSAKLLRHNRIEMEMTRDSMEFPDRDGYLERLMYEGKHEQALQVANEKLRVAHEMGDTGTETKMRRYLGKLSGKPD